MDDSYYLAKWGDLEAGDVIRVLDPACAFCDAVILGFDPKGNAKVSRPYVYASGVGTTGPNPLLGAETFSVTQTNLKHYIGLHGVLARGKVTS